ncbi:UDP-N-acetylmuramoyl-tripeptide--D-alanyl-D-alanine ligase [Alphaproteobacteria bacterium]
MRPALWDSWSISKALGIPLEADVVATDVVIDSRSVAHGALFIGLKGNVHNGSVFAVDAIRAGAVLCIVDHIPYDPYGYHDVNTSKFIVVEDTHKALIQLARFARQRFHGKVIGITGSAGKTSAKEMLRFALSGVSGKVFANAGNRNNIYGLPLSLCQLPKDYEFAVLEMAMSHAGEIEELSELAKPHISLITNVYQAHLGSFKDVEAIAHAKAEIYEHATQGGYAIINVDGPYASFLQQKAKARNLHIVTFSQIAKSDVKLVECSFNMNEILRSEGSTVVKACYFSKMIEYVVGSIGENFVLNSLAVLATVVALGLNADKVMSHLSPFAALPGRGKISHLRRNIILIDDSYNANPASVKASINRLVHYKQKKGRLIAVLGDMKELGENAVRLHLELLHHIQNNKIDKFFAVGEHMNHLFSAMPDTIKGVATYTAKEAVPKVLEHIQAYDTVLVKGSFSMHMQHIVEEIISKFS